MYCTARMHLIPAIFCVVHFRCAMHVVDVVYVMLCCVMLCCVMFCYVCMYICMALYVMYVWMCGCMYV